MAARLLAETATAADSGIVPARAWGCDLRGLLLALSWLTVLPVRVAGRGRRTAPRRVRCAGRRSSGRCWARPRARCWSGCAALGVPAAGLLAVGFLALATRGMHVDGLADTADGLGCYGPPERALAVMREGGVGAFAVVTLLVVARGAGRGARPRSAARIPPSRSRRRRWPRRPAGPGSPGAPAAGCPPPGRAGWARRWRARSRRGSAPLWWVALAAAGVAAVPGRPWQGPLAVALARGAWSSRCPRTPAAGFGGMTGDVLGAANELAVTAALAVLAAGSATPPAGAHARPGRVRGPRGRVRRGRACASRSGCPGPCRAGCR